VPNQAEPVGKSGKNVTHARERARLLKAQRERREARRRLLIRVGIPLLVVVLVIAVMVAVRATQQPAAAPALAPASGSADAAVTQALAAIPADTFNAVGTGTVKAAPTAITGPALTADDKPRVLYVGAEYCPYCAAERWPMVVALSRFGTFSDLGQTTSASADVYPSTATLSFHGAGYTSDLLSFTGVETTTNVPSGNGYTPLDTLSVTDQALDSQYNSAGSIPFVDFGNKYLISGASYDPAVLQGLTHEQIATALADPSSPVAQAVIGTANVITAALCNLTDNHPADVCSSAGVVAGAAKLAA
jgi:hypothetical protein